MLVRLGRFVVRRRVWVLVATAAGFMVAGAVGGGVAEHLSTGGFVDPGTEAERALRILEDEFDAEDPSVLLLVTAEQGTVDDPAAARAGAALEAELGDHPQVTRTLSYWSLNQAPPFRSDDGGKALILAQVAGDEDAVDAAAEDIVEAFHERQEGPLSVGVGGFAPVFNEVSETIESDLATAEAVAIPITLILLVLVFGSVVAASLPLAVGGLAIIGTFFVLRMLAELTQISIFALNMTTAMGLGLAIDYSLFVVSRFREELHSGVPTHDAVVRTIDTAGRTVLFSALTVAASLSALLIFDFAFLRSFAYAGVPVVMLAATGSIITLPALLAVLGPRVDKWALFRRTGVTRSEGMWHRIATFVMARPLPIAGAVIALLLLLGAPALRMELGLPDDRVQGEGAETRQVHDEIRESFEGNEAQAISVIGRGIGDAAERGGDISGYAARLSDVEGVSRVDAVTGTYVDGQEVAPPAALAAGFVADDATWIRVVPAVEPISPAGEDLVGDLRAVDAPFERVVGGVSAELRDSKSSLFADIPLALILIGVVTFVVLFLMFGSVVVPAKAIVLNLLSLTATFGAMVWIFQDGHFADLLGVTTTGTLDITTPILMFCIAFGLSMDYEVFLLSRVKEEWDRSGDNEAAVALGLERTGRIVTAAAALISVVFLAMVSSSIAFIKLFGLGLAVAVIVDATLVRATLVPAFMRLAGRANWWAPPPLARLHRRVGFAESSASDATYEELVVAEVPASPQTTTANGEHPQPGRRRPLVAPGRPGRALLMTPEERESARRRVADRV